MSSIFIKDSAKISLVFAKFLLKIVNLWPENTNKFQSLTFSLIILILFYVEFGQIIFLTSNVNISKFISVISQISVTLQALSKIIVLFIYSKKLNEIIHKIWFKFLPSNIFGKNIENEIKFTTNIYLYYSLITYISGVILSLALFSTPYLSGLKELPYKLWYPFDWTLTPIYQILYVFHGVINLYLVLNAICGYDLLYLSICLNLIAQFRLIGEVLKNLGDGDKENDILFKLNDHNEDKNLKNKEELLIIFIKRHRKIIWTCNQLNLIFALGHIIQLTTSVTSLCVSLFLINLNGIKEGYQILTYCFGHLSQLFLLCSISNELSYWSENFTTSLHLSNWYNKDLKKIKSYIILMTLRSFKGDSMNAMGLIKLNYGSFIAVLKFSFSLYTVMGALLN